MKIATFQSDLASLEKTINDYIDNHPEYDIKDIRIITSDRRYENVGIILYEEKTEKVDSNLLDKLREEIIESKVSYIKLSIPKGHCPYAYYDPAVVTHDCDTIDCDKCRLLFEEFIEKEIRERVYSPDYLID